MKRLSLLTSVSYGAVSLFTTIIHNVFLLYHVDMYVSVFKIDKKSFWIAEAIFLLWNSVNDPLFGWLGDKNLLSSTTITSNCPEHCAGENVLSVDSAAGSASSLTIVKRLRMLTICGPFLAGSFALFWFPLLPVFIQFTLCLCLYDGFLTMVDLHHSALLADLAVTAEERASMNFFQSVFSALGAITVFISYLFWEKTNLRSYRVFCVTLSIISVVGFIVITKILKRSYCQNIAKNEERLYSPQIAKNVTVTEFIKQLSSHKNFVCFTMINFIQVFHCHFNSNFFPLFLETMLNDYSRFGSVLLAVSFVMPHINNMFFLVLCTKYGVYGVVKGLFLVKFLLAAVMLMVGVEQSLLLCVFIASNRIFTEGTCKLLNLVITDLIDEDYVRNRRQEPASALMFGMANFLAKPGQTLAPLVGTTLLSVITGHDVFQTGLENGSTQLDLKALTKTEFISYRQACFYILVYVPIVCAAAQSFIWAFFRLHGTRLQIIKNLRSNLRLLQV